MLQNVLTGQNRTKITNDCTKDEERFNTLWCSGRMQTRPKQEELCPLFFPHKVLISFLVLVSKTEIRNNCTQSPIPRGYIPPVMSAVAVHLITTTVALRVKEIKVKVRMVGSTIMALNTKGEGSKRFPQALPNYVFPWTLQRPPMTRPEEQGTEKVLPWWLDAFPSRSLELTKSPGNLNLIAMVALCQLLTSPNAACFLATAPLWSVWQRRRGGEMPPPLNFPSNDSAFVGRHPRDNRQEAIFFRRYLPIKHASGFFHSCEFPFTRQDSSVVAKTLVETPL